MLTPPKDAPPRYQVQRLVEFSSFDDWAEVSRLFAQLFATAAKLDPRSPVRVEAARIAAANATPLERASAALRLPDEINLFDIDARAGFDAPAKVTATTILRRVKGLQQQLQFSPISSDQLSAALRQQLVGPLWQSIDTVKWHFDERAQASVLTIVGTWMIDWSNDGGAARSYALPGGGFSPPDRRARSADQNQQVPFYRKPEYDCSVTTLRVPAQTRLDRWSTKDGFDTVLFGTHYYRGFERRDGAIRMIRGLRVEHPEVDAESARKDNARIATFDNSMGWASYDPAPPSPPAKPTTAIPATDEIDWIGDNVPCLGGAASSASREVPAALRRSG